MKSTSRSSPRSFALLLLVVSPLAAGPAGKLRRSAGPARDHRRAHLPPAPASRRSSRGSAVVFAVNVKGKVVAVNVVRTDNREFNQLTLDAIKGWAFAPALNDRQPVEARLQRTFVVSVRDLPELNRNEMIAQKKTR
jgi:TonB family protein